MDPYITLQDDGLNISGYCPISVKAEKNKHMHNNYPVTNEQMFLSNRNTYILVHYIISLNVKNNTKTQHEILRKKIPEIMVKWAADKKINDYEDLNDNLLTTLTFLNKQFLGDHPELYNRADCSGINVYRITGRVTDRCNRQSNKRHDEMLASDYHTLDVWQPHEVFTSNKNNRYCNRVPIWQKSMNTRHHDRCNDGLRDAIPERASLNNQIHGYDMSNIIKGSTYYENPSYENV